MKRKVELPVEGLTINQKGAVTKLLCIVFSFFNEFITLMFCGVQAYICLYLLHNLNKLAKLLAVLRFSEKSWQNRHVLPLMV